MIFISGVNSFGSSASCARPAKASVLSVMMVRVNIFSFMGFLFILSQQALI